MTRLKADSEPSRGADLLERWLAAHLLDPASPTPQPTTLPRQTTVERLVLLQDILEQRPALAHAARRLAMYDQFRLTLELLRGTRQPAATRADTAAGPHAVISQPLMARCFARPAGRRRRPR